MSVRLPGTPRRRRVAVLGALLLLLVAVLFYPQAYSLRFSPSPENAWLLFLLSALSFFGIVVLALVLMRQVAKLYAERRAHVLGAQFKTKLVTGALVLSLTPVVCMFGFTYGLINRTLDKWFSQPVVTVRDDNQSTLEMLTSFVSDNAEDEALSLAASPGLAAALHTGRRSAVEAELATHVTTLEGGFAAVLDPAGRMLTGFQVPPGYRPQALRTAVLPVSGLRELIAGRTYVVARARLAGTGQVEVAMPLPPALLAQVARLAQDRDRYDRLARERRSLRLIYTSYLVLLTLATLFGATWMALHLSRAVTVPVAELAAATQEIAQGNLAYRVRMAPPGGKDELGKLVDSFNTMAGDLQHTQQELDARRRYTETLLENTPTAVISLDGRYRVERINPAVTRLFGPLPGGRTPRALDDLFDAGSLREMQHLLRKAERWPAATGQIEVALAGGQQRTLAATVAAIADGGGAGPAGRRPRTWAGYVLVLEDLTDLLSIQKTAAWREVAQRIAHEIKNPLTPIALSAERIRRRLAAGEGGAAGRAEVIGECAATIEAEVRTLQRLVDEFGAFARFPRARPVPCHLNEVIEQALRAFDGRLEGIEVRTRFDPLPTLRLDPDDMKRVFINLIDNAAEAMQASPYRQLTLATQALDGGVEAVVADTGHGLPAADKQRLFLPYYSTRERGSGLGLAIVQRIVEENGGTLRAEDNTPLGARFIVELPWEAEAEAEAAPGRTSG